MAREASRNPTKRNETRRNPYTFLGSLQFCVDTHSAHAPGSWNIISVDMTGGQSEKMREQAVKMVEEADCTAGSEDLCSCSQLIKRGAIDNFDECTQEAAIEYCKQFGGCSVSGTF